MLNPSAPAGYVGMAEVAGRRGDSALTEEWLRKGLRAAPRDLVLLLNLGKWLAGKGQLAEAERTLALAVEVAPRSVQALSMLGDLYLARSNTLVKAEDLFRRAVEVEPGNVSAQIGLARALAGGGKTAEAQRVLESAVKAAPTNPSPLHAQARIWAIQGNFDEAVKYHQRAISVAPEFLQAYLDQGDLYLARNEVDKAIAVYRSAIGKVRDPVPSLFRIGVANEAAGRWEEAERAYIEAVSREPKLFGAYNNLAFMAANRKVNLDQALAWAQKANELAPRSATVRDTLGWVHRARGDLPVAARLMEEAAKLDPRDATVRYHLGIVYSEMGRKTAATAAFKQALEVNPNFRHAKNARERLQELGAK
jgi:tetratricopeptide (TPR) repeat protein